MVLILHSGAVGLTLAVSTSRIAQNRRTKRLDIATSKAAPTLPRLVWLALNIEGLDGLLEVIQGQRLKTRKNQE